MSIEEGPDPWIDGPTPIALPFDEQSICEALDQEGIGYEILRGLRDEHHGHIFLLITHPTPPEDISHWCILKTMEEAHAFFRGWRLCKIAYQSEDGPKEE